MLHDKSTPPLPKETRSSRMRTISANPRYSMPLRQKNGQLISPILAVQNSNTCTDIPPPPPPPMPMIPPPPPPQIIEIADNPQLLPSFTFLTQSTTETATMSQNHKTKPNRKYAVEYQVEDDMEKDSFFHKLPPIPRSKSEFTVDNPSNYNITSSNTNTDSASKYNRSSYNSSSTRFASRRNKKKAEKKRNSTGFFFNATSPPPPPMITEYGITTKKTKGKAAKQRPMSAKPVASRIKHWNEKHEKHKKTLKEKRHSGGVIRPTNTMNKRSSKSNKSNKHRNTKSLPQKVTNDITTSNKKQKLKRRRSNIPKQIECINTLREFGKNEKRKSRKLKDGKVVLDDMQFYVTVNNIETYTVIYKTAICGLILRPFDGLLLMGAKVIGFQNIFSTSNVVLHSLLIGIGDQIVLDMKYEDILRNIRLAERPLKLTFYPPPSYDMKRNKKKVRKYQSLTLWLGMDSYLRFKVTRDTKR